MDHQSVTRTAALTVLGLAMTFSAAAQWQWLDKDGRRVFSDRSPPSDIPEKNILKQPAGSKRTTTLAVTDATVAPTALPASQPAGNVPKLSGKDPQLAAKKKQAEEEEAAKKKADEDKLAKVKAENCARAKDGLTTFESGARVAVRNAKGEREIMDDAPRAVEVKRLQGIVSTECR